jgi:hypothetical protein
VYRNDEFDIDEIAELTKYCYLPVPKFRRSRIAERYHSKYGATKYTWRLSWTASNWEAYGGTSILKKVYHGIATMVKR